MNGMDIVKKMEQLGTADGRTSGLVKIVDCGEVLNGKMQSSIVAEKGIALVRCKRLFLAFMSN